MSQALSDSRRALFRRVAAMGAAGVVVSAGVEGLVGDEAAAAERRKNRKKSCARFEKKSKRRNCRKRKRRQKNKNRNKNKDKKDDSKPVTTTDTAPTPVTPVPPTAPPPTAVTPTTPVAPTPSPLPDLPTTALLGASERHLVNRFSFGLTTSLADEVTASGGARAWFEAQLEPASIPDPEADSFRSWWPGLVRSHGDLWTRQKNGIEGGWQVMEDLQRWLLLRRMYSKRQVSEMMTDFWMNHLNVPINGDAHFTHRLGYDATIRTHALGRFDEMLQAAITHPAMGIYLDNAVSTKSHPNENLGRELLEVHTVGQGQYTEDDVKNSARILTGFRVDMFKTFDAFYSAQDHWVGKVDVMGFSDPNVATDGRAVAASYLRHLAHHPSTARRIARKLAIKFVNDNPSTALVDELAQVYLANDTAIKPVLRALIDSTEFKGSAGQKLRDPSEDLVATYRVLGIKLQAPPNAESGDWGINAALWQAKSIGLAPGDWVRPDGAPVDNESWSSPARIVASMQEHFNMAGGYWPGQGITYRTPAQWLPVSSVRFDDLVSHISRTVLHQPATEQLQTACRQAVGDVAADTIISIDHPVIRWKFHRLLVTFLDSPANLAR